MSKHEDWDYENAEVHEPEREVMSVYSLRFTSTEIADIRAAARQEGVTTSEFIRSAARSRATLQTVPAEAVRAFALAVASVTERYEEAGEGGTPSAEDLAGWLEENSSQGEPAQKATRKTA